MVIPANIQAQIDPLEANIKVLEEEVRQLILELALNRRRRFHPLKVFWN